MLCVVKIYQWLNVRPISNHCISSAENEVLRVSFSDRSLSVVSQSSVVSQPLLTKHLWNYWAKFNDFMGSLVDPLQKYNKALRLNNKMADLLFCFKRHLWNYQTNFNETLQEASLHVFKNSNNIIFCKQNISYTTVPNLMQLHWKLPGLTLYQKIQRMQLITNKMSDFLFCIKKHLLWTY